MIEELLVYQEADGKLRKIEVELSSSEELKKAYTAKKYLDGVEENINNLDAHALKLTEEFDKITAEQQKLKEQEQELYKAAENVENDASANYLLKKIDELMSKMKALSIKADEISKSISNAMKEYVNIKNTTKAMQVQYSENGKKYNELKLKLQPEKEKIEKELEVLKKKVDSALMERYLQKRANKIYPILFEVRQNSDKSINFCGACNMEISMNEMTKLKNGEVIDCGNCGRLIYLKK